MKREKEKKKKKKTDSVMVEKQGRRRGVPRWGKIRLTRTEVTQHQWLKMFPTGAAVGSSDKEEQMPKGKKIFFTHPPPPSATSP